MKAIKMKIQGRNMRARSVIKLHEHEEKMSEREKTKHKCARLSAIETLIVTHQHKTVYTAEKNKRKIRSYRWVRNQRQRWKKLNKQKRPRKIFLAELNDHVELKVKWVKIYRGANYYLIGLYTVDEGQRHWK